MRLELKWTMRNEKEVKMPKHRNLHGSEDGATQIREETMKLHCVALNFDMLIEEIQSKIWNLLFFGIIVWTWYCKLLLLESRERLVALFSWALCRVWPSQGRTGCIEEEVGYVGCKVGGLEGRVHRVMPKKRNLTQRWRSFAWMIGLWPRRVCGCQLVL